MKTLFGIFSFSLCASFIIFAPPSPASAQSFRQTRAPSSRADLPLIQLRRAQAASGANAAAKAGTFITFDVPGSTCLPTFGFPSCTVAVGINPGGTITGSYDDANASLHGFLRAGDGTFTTFDVPGSTCTVPTTSCAQPTGINDAGAVTGTYQDASFAVHGFLRTGDGTFTTFDPPGSINTQPTGINPAGTITGWYEGLQPFLVHGFMRTPGGTLTTFAFGGPGALTFPSGINPAGAITGYYCNDTCHGFLRARDGTLTTFDPKDSIFTQPSGINPAGEITGYYQDASFVAHGFLRAADGTFTTFDPPGSLSTQTTGINPAGAITGWYQYTPDSVTFLIRSFLRNP